MFSNDQFDKTLDLVRTWDTFPKSVAKKIQLHLAVAFRQLLRPLVRILLRHGFSYGDFSDVSKAVFFEVAAEDFSLTGNRSSDSRVAILTGLTRKEVARQRQLALRREMPAPGSMSRASRVLWGWHQDPDFTGPFDVPLTLAFDQRTPNFTKLVKRYSGDMPARAMLEELIRVGAVQETQEGDYEVLKRSYIPVQATEESIKRLGTVMHDLAATLEFNLDPGRVGKARFERRVISDTVPEDAMTKFQELLEVQGQRFLESFDNWLTAQQEPIDASVKLKEHGTAERRTGVGIYYFEVVSNLEDTE